MSAQRRSFGQRINAWLDEPEGEQFADGKWRFWLPAVLGFSILNAVLTVMIFRESASANYLTPALLAASAIVSWIAIGCLHYSDAKRGRMARGVSALDSASLLFVIGHFCFLVYILGHSWILRGDEADYRAALKEYNANAQAFHAGNEKIADALRDAAKSQETRAKIEADTAYQLRKAAQAGARIRRESGGVTANIEMAKVELPPPPKAPDDTATAFLTRWDAWVRITNFGELILAALTLIFIRNWTAKTNSPSENPTFFGVTARSPAMVGNLTTKSDRGTTVVHFDRKKARRKLLDHLGVISSYNPGKWFKADLVEGGVHIRMCARVNTIEETIADTRQSDKLLMAVDKPDFRERLIEELRHQGFEI
jgi:hypothetical protein